MDSSDIGFLSTLSPRNLHPSCGAIFTNAVHLSSHSNNSTGEGPVRFFPADTCASLHPQEFSHFLDYLERIARMSGVGVGLPGSEEPAFAGDDRQTVQHDRYVGVMQPFAAIGDNVGFMNRNLHLDSRKKTFVANRERRAMSHHEKRMRRKAKQTSNMFTQPEV